MRSPASLPGRAGILSASRQSAALILLLGVSVAILAWNAGLHYFLTDDAFISFRYARNLVEGRGLVFNAGERVEGYTNFLWVLELAGLWLLGASPLVSSVVLSVLYTLGTLVVTARLAATTPFRGRELAVVAAAVFLLCINRNVAVWTTGGLETRQFTFFVVLAVYWMRRDGRGAWRAVPASLAWSAAELTRPEGLLLFGCGLLWLLEESWFRRRFRAVELLGYVAPFAAVVGAHFLFRWVYYGELLPNTYYAKVVGPWPEAGFHYLTVALVENGLYVVLPVAALGAVARAVKGGDGVHFLSLLCIALHASYLVRVGGDHFEFRALDFYWPLLAVAVADGIVGLAGLSRRALARAAPDLETAGSWTFGGALLGAVALYSVVVQIAHESTTRHLTLRKESAWLAAQITPENFSAAYTVPVLKHLLPAYNAALAFCAEHAVGVRWRTHESFWRLRMRQYADYGPYTEELFPPDAVMELATVGVAPFYLGNLTIIDTLGLTDRVVARTPTVRAGGRKLLGHDRSAPPGYLAQRGVNLVVGPAQREWPVAGVIAGTALRLDEGLWMPLMSPKPRWLREAFGDRDFWSIRLEPEPESNEIVAGGHALEVVRALGLFDAEADAGAGWTARGAGVGQRWSDGQELPPGCVGTGWIGSRGPGGDPRPVGDLTSAPFAVPASGRLAFLLAGDPDRDVGVELLVDDAVVATWRGRDADRPRLVLADLDAFAGRQARLRVFDRTKAGSVRADHFLLVGPPAAADG